MLATYIFSEDDKKNNQLDFIGGIEIIDSTRRIFCIEGISNKAMKRIEETIPRQYANTYEFRYLKNHSLKFRSRLYWDYNLELKKIRLREKLENFLKKPNIFLREKVSENVQKILIQFAQLREIWNIKSALQFDLFPTVDNLVEIERKYSQKLSEEDQTGMNSAKTLQQLDQKSSVQTISLPKLSTTFVSDQLKSEQLFTEQESRLGKSNHTQNTQFLKSLKQQAKKLNNQNPYNLHCSEIADSKQTEIYMYSSQTKNYYTQQKQLLREKVQTDKKNFYTYSKDFLSLSIDPYDVQEVEKLSKSKQSFSSTKPFQTLPHKSYQQTLQHPKDLPVSAKEELTQPWHQSYSEKLAALKPLRDVQQFDSNSKKPLFIAPLSSKFKYFSQFEKGELEKQSAVQLSNYEKQLKDKEVQEWKQKLIGKSYFSTSNIQRKSNQIDKYKGLLVDKPKKFSLILPNSKLSKSKIHLQKILLPEPASIFAEEEYKQGNNSQILRDFELEKAINDYDFNRYSKHNPLISSNVYKPEIIIDQCK